MNPDPLVGQQIDQYLVQDFIARGGMASVYLARDVALDRPVALKMMLSELAQDPAALARFQREAQTVARLNHPHIIQIYTTGMTPDGRPYLAMQYVQGGSLQQKLARLAQEGRHLSAGEALRLGHAVAQALQVAHREGIIHRDLKPSNILLHPDGSPVLTDLGIAAVQQATTRLTQTGSIMGTPHYMAPEQARGQAVDGRTDIYALGIILYEMLAGRVPFNATSPLAVLHQHISEPPPPLERVRPGLAAVTYQTVQNCLAKAPDERFASAGDLALALQHALAAEEGRASSPLSPYPDPATAATPAPATPQRARWPLALGAVLILALLGAFAVWQNMSSAAEGSETPLPTRILPTATAVAAEDEADAIAVAATATLQPSATAVPPTPTATPTSTALPTQVPLTTSDVVASRLGPPPTIDGDLSDWPVIQPVLSGERVYSDGDWDGSDDVTAVWRLGWDADNLYLGVSVADDVHVQTQTGRQVYRGDSIELQFDSDPAGDPGPGLTPDDFQINISPGDFGALPPSAVRSRGNAEGRSGDAPGHAIRVAAQPTADGYVIEAAVPWRDLSVTAAPGLVIGLALNVTDNDTPGSAVQEVMYSNVSTRTYADPTTWGTLTLRE